MNNRWPVVLTLAVTLSSCTSVLVETTGDQGIQENPVRRTAAAVLEDEFIETKVVVNIKSQEPALKKANIAAVSHNGVVLLIGQVESAALKDRAAAIASQASIKIKRIQNELEVEGKTGWLSRGNDSWIATKVRARMRIDREVPAEQIRVVTENGTVYLMGLISQIDGDTAADIASKVTGVQRVVKVFEYIN